MPTLSPATQQKLQHALFNLFVLALLIFYLSPMAFMGVTALMSSDQLADATAPLYPAKISLYPYNGEATRIYYVPTAEGVKQWALVMPGRTASEFIDPQNPAAGLITWAGNWRTLANVYEFSPTWENFTVLFRALPFGRMFTTTLFITLVAEVAVLGSSVLVAYGFARFKLPGGNLLFYILIATLLIPEKITFIPTFFFYTAFLKWRGTLYPILVPFFFGNAIYIFLLRQHFKSLPIDLEESAMLDGAGPLRRLFSVILPQSWPVLVTIAVLHFFFMWNETRQASLYLSVNSSLMPLSFGVQNYQSRIPIQNVIEASTLVVLAIPLLLLFLTQRFFMQGLVLTGEATDGERARRQNG